MDKKSRDLVCFEIMQTLYLNDGFANPKLYFEVWLFITPLKFMGI